MIGYKQAYTINHENIVLVKLDIPDELNIHHIKQYGDTKDFYYCNSARVISITSFDCRHRVKMARSMKDPSFIYEVGKVVVARSNDDIYALGNQKGIYFFKTRKQAKEYNF